MNTSTFQNSDSSENSDPASAPADQGQNGNKTKNAEPPLNVIILGETANGKSTLIRQLGVYAGDTNPNVKIGDGQYTRI
jgi:predicted GTPase